MIDIQKIIPIIRVAGTKVLDIYSTDFEVFFKEDRSPISLADKLSHTYITESLLALYPSIPVLSEEGDLIEYEQRKKWKMFWLIDPLDGTKEFIKKNGDFTLNIALIENGVPTIGLVYAPVFDVIYYAKKGKGAYKEIKGKQTKLLFQESEIVRKKIQNKEFLKIAITKSHHTKEFDKYLKNFYIQELYSLGSSLKLCYVGDGSVDLSPRLGTTMEWDIAAAHAILREVGKGIYCLGTQEELRYNKQNLINPYFEAY